MRRRANRTATGARRERAIVEGQKSEIRGQRSDVAGTLANLANSAMSVGRLLPIPSAADAGHPGQAAIVGQAQPTPIGTLRWACGPNAPCRRAGGFIPAARPKSPSKFLPIRRIITLRA